MCNVALADGMENTVSDTAMLGQPFEQEVYRYKWFCFKGPHFVTSVRRIMRELIMPALL